MGDMPDFESMSEEEQMRWLESLAKRQGAHEGFTTSADIEVPEVDPNSVVIDEPGYTPYYASSSSSQASQPATPTPPPAPTPEPPPAQEPVATPMASQAEPDYSAMVGDDPMAWLESLAKRQGAYEGFTTAADMEVAEIDPNSVVIDEPGYTPYYESSKKPEAAPPPSAPAETFQAAPPPPAPEPIAVEPPAPPVVEAPAAAMPITDGELPADIDPMKWLESLAKRQGAYEGFTTSADMEVAEVDPNSVVIDEPGYTPYYSSSTTSSVASTPAAPPPPPAPEPVAESYPAGMPDDAGALFEEEPGDTWLYQLAEDQGSDVDDFLSELTDDTIPGFDEPLAADIRSSAAEDPAFQAIKGLSDADIAAAQAAGTITPEQELAWLKSKIAGIPDVEDDEMFASEDLGELSEAEPTEVPAWLKAQMPDETELGQMGDTEFSFDLAGDITDSFTNDVDELDLATLGLGNDAMGGFTIDEPAIPQESSSLLEGYSPEVDEWAHAIDTDLEIADIGSVPEPEWYTQAVERAEADFTLDIGEPLNVDIPAFETESAISDSNFLAEDDDLPSWLQGVDTTPVVEEDSDLPAWLRTAPANTDSDVASWLDQQMVGEPEPVMAASTAYGLPSDERLPYGNEGVLPGWYAAFAPSYPETAPAPVVEKPVTPPPAPTPPPVQQPVASQPPAPSAAPTPAPQRPTAPPPPPPPTQVEQKAVVLPDDPQFAEYRTRLEQNPTDHDTRLTLARQLGRTGNVNDSLGQYEALIQNAVKLDVVTTDLTTLIKQLPSHPKARRLLGDVYMRQGRLQEALDTYRGALDQI